MSAVVAGYPHSFFSDSGISATVVNGLTDTNRRVRKKSIGKLYSKISEINGSGEDISGLSEVFKCLKTPLLRLLCDDSEFCRDVSLKLLGLFFSLAREDLTPLFRTTLSILAPRVIGKNLSKTQKK